MHIYFSGNYFKQDRTRIPNNNNAINIYIAYKLDPIVSSRDTTFTTQNALFGAMQITKNADTSKYDSSVLWGLLAQMGSGFLQILNHLKTLKYH